MKKYSSSLSLHVKYSFHLEMLESVNRRSQHENSVWEFVETTVHQSVLNYQTETANRLCGSQEKMSATEVADMLVAAVQGENVIVKMLLRACAWAPPGSDESTVGVNYQKAVSVLKESAVWKKNVHVQNWLTSNRLNHPQVSYASQQGNFPTWVNS